MAVAGEAEAYYVVAGDDLFDGEAVGGNAKDAVAAGVAGGGVEVSIAVEGEAMTEVAGIAISTW